MTKKKESIRDYRFSDGILKQKADDIASSVTRDITQFNTRGVTADTVTAFETLAQEFDDLPTDEEAQGDVSDATEIKDAAAEALKVKIRTIRTMAQNKWGDGAAKYRSFGFEGMDDMNDSDLHRLGKRVGRRATANLAALESEGLTEDMITALGTANTTFDDAIDAMEDKVKDRDLSTQSRVDKGNACYKELVRLCNIGKDLWAARDEAKYNDYVIYNTPGGTAPSEPPPPGS